MKCAAVDVVVRTGRDNTDRLVLHADGDLLTDLGALTRATLEIGATLIDSDTDPGALFWGPPTLDYHGQQTEVLSLRLGHQGLAAGTYSGTLKVFDNGSYTNGLRVEPDLAIEVRA